MRYKGGPYWITARFGICKQCGKSIKGQKAYYYPANKAIYCEDCGGQKARDNAAMRADEDFISGNLAYELEHERF